MKKITLTALALMASAASFAQTTLWNGEDKELGTTGTGFWDRCTPEVVENPTKDAVNSSDKCLKFTITGTNWDNGDVAMNIADGNQFASKRLSLKIKKADRSNVKVQLTYNNGTGNAFKNVAAWYDGEGEWRTLYFDFSTNGEFSNPTEIAIYPTTDNFEGQKEVYIDDVQIEDLPTVGGVTLNNVTDGSLNGNIKLAGTWLKGECQNVDVDPWQKVEYNDFVKVNAKLSDAVTSVDMRGTVTKDVDVNQFFKNPNTIVYADGDYNHANVVVGGNAANVELTDANAFAIPENFTAASVKLTRTLREGINSFVLPFGVNPDELGATELATYYNKSEGNDVAFVKKDKVEANVPFITCNVAADKAGEDIALNFTDKGFVATPATFDEAFKGVYAPRNANGLYGIDNNGKLHKGGETATINAFHAFYQPAVGQEVAAAISFTSEVTGISAVTTTSSAAATVVYDLSGRRVADSLAAGRLAKGIYVVGGKKVAVK
ncbi:hypothetical protein [Leyella stercorea]|uniref:hypothetical protein n=1 Tax=Leyella stercorea TaxID=363265 RepID=UPI00242F9CE9|nr:hypothetical protein [Leyella stercorea]